MPSIDVKKRRIQSKIVYYGPGRSGKTTILRCVHRRLDENQRGRFTQMPTKADPSLHIDVVPVQFGTVLGFQSIFHLCSGPGQAAAVNTRQLLLRDTDGIVFVADSDPRRRLANEDALMELRENLAGYGLSLRTVPHVFLYHKSDLDQAVPPEELRQQLNRYGVPDFQTSVSDGRGIMQSLRAIVRGVSEDLRRRL